MLYNTQFEKHVREFSESIPGHLGNTSCISEKFLGRSCNSSYELSTESSFLIVLISNCAHLKFCQVFMDPRLGTDTSGPGEAVFAIRFNGKPQFLLNF